MIFKLSTLKVLFSSLYVRCDTYSNCLPGRSKKITKCTIFSGHTCDGCEEGYYLHQDLGCDKCSPKCDATIEDEIQACTTKHNRVCAPKRVLPKTPPIFSKLILSHLLPYLVRQLLNEGLETFLLQMTIHFFHEICVLSSVLCNLWY